MHHTVSWLSSNVRISSARVLRRLAGWLDPRPAGGAAVKSLVGDFFGMLQASGYKPTTIVDVGAHAGGWTKEVILHYPDASFVLFEPQTEMLPALESLKGGNTHVDINIVGVGAKSGTFALTIDSNRKDSSTFRHSAEAAEARGFSQRQISVVALDEFFESRGQVPSIVKIDAEGWDLDVIQGGERTIAGADIAFVECGILNRHFENDLRTVANRMDDLGFRLVDFTAMNRTPARRALWLVEAAFVKNGTNLDRLGTSYE
jgi:FkbM family methyltransferase